MGELILVMIMQHTVINK